MEKEESNASNSTIEIVSISTREEWVFKYQGEIYTIVYYLGHGVESATDSKGNDISNNDEMIDKFEEVADTYRTDS